MVHRLHGAVTERDFFRYRWCKILAHSIGILYILWVKCIHFWTSAVLSRERFLHIAPIAY